MWPKAVAGKAAPAEQSVVAAKTAHKLFGDDADYTVINVATDQPVYWGNDPLGAGLAYPLVIPPVGAGGMAATFSALSVLPLVFLAEIAFAVAFGVLLDTLVVRSLLVPSLTVDIGRRIWWPGKLHRCDP